MKFCTIAHAGKLAHARVLAGGLAEHQPGARLTVLLTGTEDVTAADEPFDLVRPCELGVSGWEDLFDDHRWADLSELLKPHLLTHLMLQGAEIAVYLDASVDLHSPLSPVARQLARHGGVIASRIASDLPSDGRRPDGADLRRAGRLGASLIALHGTAAPGELLRWWAGRLMHAASLPPSPGVEGEFASRALSRWIDLAPAIFGGIDVLSDQGSAVSYWNLHERPLERHGERLSAGGRRLCFMHFEGFDPYRPFLLNESADRVRVSDSATLAELCESYAERLKASGWRDPRRRADVGRLLANGMTFDNRLSHLLAEAAAAGEEPNDIFSEEGTEALMQWLEGSAFPGSGSEVNRYLYRIYRERDDLQVAYPDILGSDAEGFRGWSWVFGKSEMGIPERVLPSRPDDIKSSLPAEQVTLSRGQTRPRRDRPALSMNVTGLLTGTLGLGEAARAYVQALQAAGIETSTSTVDIRQFVEITSTAHEGYARVEFAELAGAERAGFNLICINPDELPLFAESVGDAFFAKRPSIGVWAWETDHIPERWRRSFDFLDEIWVYSKYVAENLERVAPIPIRRIPPPVLPPDPGNLDLDLDVPEGYRFLFMFDFFSTIQRKNPVGLIEAFRRAFSPGEGPQLVIKTINGVHRQQALEEVLWAARGRPDIHVIDRSLSARERDALVAGCDCYVSLHRSEGFGLTLAECMVLGKPVIGTAFSGTTDFMTGHNSYPVAYEMTRVGADCEIYPPEGTWADPDLDDAARLMRRVVEQPEEARERARRAQSRIEELFSPQAVGALIRRRLEEIIAIWRGPDLLRR